MLLLCSFYCTCAGNMLSRRFSVFFIIMYWVIGVFFVEDILMSVGVNYTIVLSLIMLCVFL